MARILKGDAERMLGAVPEESTFKCCDGTVFRSMEDLGTGLNTMSDDAFAYHSNMEKSDFGNWVEHVVQDGKLARDLRKAATRAQAARSVEQRIAFLKGKLY